MINIKLLSTQCLLASEGLLLWLVADKSAVSYVGFTAISTMNCENFEFFGIVDSRTPSAGNCQLPALRS